MRAAEVWEWRARLAVVCKHFYDCFKKEFNQREIVAEQQRRLVSR